jgi:hypothetical protein
MRWTKPSGVCGVASDLTSDAFGSARPYSSCHKFERSAPFDKHRLANRDVMKATENDNDNGYDSS